MRIRRNMSAKKAKKLAAKLLDSGRQERAAEAVAVAQKKRQASRALSPASSPQEANGEALPGPPPAAPAAALPAAASALPVPPPPAPPPSEPTLSELKALLVRLTDQVAGLSAHSAQQGVQLAAMGDALKAAEDRAARAEDRAEQLEEKLACELARADQRQEGLDRAMRRDKLMLFGVPEGGEASPQARVEALLRDVGCTAAGKVAEAVRLKPARAPTGAAPSASRARPVRVTFATPSSVYEVFKSCKALREQKRVFVDKDLTTQQRAVRTSLMGEYKELRENGQRAFWVGERLFYAGDRGSRATQVHPRDQLSRRQGSSPTQPPGLA